MTPSILTLDAGTTSVKACLFSRDLHLRKQSSREYALRSEGLLVEAAPEVYLDAVRDAIRNVLSPEDRLAAIGLTTQGETLTVTDEAGRPLRPFLVWLDQRAESQASRLAARFPEPAFYRETGLPGITGALPLAKVLWLREHEPALFAPGRRLLLLEDFLIHTLTGRFVTEKALQTSTGWFSLRRDGFWPEALDAAGLPAAMLPELMESGAQAGTVTPEAASFFGLPAGVPVFTGAMDQTCAAHAVSRFFPGAVMETTGTALVASALVPAKDPAPDLPHVTLYRGVSASSRLLLPIGNTGGMALTWFRNQFCPDLGGDYDALTRLAASAPPGAGGVLFLPFLDGSVDPDACPEARAVFFGLSLATDRACCVRAVMEGVAHLLRELLGVMDRFGSPANCVCSLGGGSRSALWQQIKADCCGRTFFTLDCQEAASLGAALLAGEGANVLASPAVPKTASSFVPGPGAAVLDEAHRSWHNLWQAVRPLYASSGRGF